MVVERFSQNLINTGIFKVYIAIGFFATLIFFIFNAELFTPIQMLFGAVLVTVALIGFSNFMLSFIVSNFSLDKKRADFEIKYNEEKISLMLNQLVAKDIQESNEKLEEEQEDINQNDEEQDKEN